jgi:hypothetical protein
MEVIQDRDLMLEAIERAIQTLGVTGLTSEVQQPPTPAESPRPHSLKIPDNIHELLENNLVRANMPSLTTAKYSLRGHPGFVVRHNRGVTREELVLAHQDARAVGFPVLPAEFIKHRDIAYAVTAKVDGEKVEEALTNNPSPEMIEAIEQMWAMMTKSLVTAHEDGSFWPADMQSLKQFMWGTIPGDDQPRLWAVDLPTNSYSLENPHVYGANLMYSILGMLKVEEALGRTMTAARQHYEAAIAQCPDSKIYGGGYKNAAAYYLANGSHMPGPYRDEASFLQAFRTTSGTAPL